MLRIEPLTYRYERITISTCRCPIDLLLRRLKCDIHVTIEEYKIPEIQR